jgi:hypothetical protein
MFTTQLVRSHFSLRFMQMVVCQLYSPAEAQVHAIGPESTQKYGLVPTGRTEAVASIRVP